MSIDADWLLAEVLTYAVGGMTASQVGEMKSAPVVRYDNVHQYWASSDQLYWHTDQDFPCVRPPFGLMWFLSGGPNTITAIEGVRPLTPRPVATVCESQTNDQGGMSIRMFHFIRVQGIPRFVVGNEILCDMDGRPSGNDVVPMWYSDDVRLTFERDYGSVDPKHMSMFVSGFYHPVLLAISFMHCKNVTLRDAPMARSVRRAKASTPNDRWYELAIGGITSRLDAERQRGASLPKALHICRGSFATYSESKPLFGKYSGRYWRPAHVRGAAESGTIHKTYAVGA